MCIYIYIAFYIHLYISIMLFSVIYTYNIFIYKNMYLWIMSIFSITIFVVWVHSQVSFHLYIQLYLYLYLVHVDRFEHALGVRTFAIQRPAFWHARQRVPKMYESFTQCSSTMPSLFRQFWTCSLVKTHRMCSNTWNMLLCSNSPTT